MAEVLKALDAITELVLAYRPKGKGEAATKVRKRLDREGRKAKGDAGE